MTAKLGDIKAWFEEGVANKQAYMLVFCDTWDHRDYPVYYRCASNARAHRDHPGEMQRFMEAYDLSMSWESQSRGYVNNLPAPEPKPMRTSFSTDDLYKIHENKFWAGGAHVVKKGEVQIDFAEGAVVIPQVQFKQLRDMLDAAEQEI